MKFGEIGALQNSGNLLEIRRDWSLPFGEIGVPHIHCYSYGNCKWVCRVCDHLRIFAFVSSAERRVEECRESRRKRVSSITQSFFVLARWSLKIKESTPSSLYIYEHYVLNLERTMLKSMSLATYESQTL